MTTQTIALPLQDAGLDGLSPEQRERLSRILDEYFCKAENGQPVEPRRLIAEHPDLAGPLVTYLESVRVLHDGGEEFVETLNDVLPNRGAAALEGRLGDYEIVREIGRGGMGVVYEARQISLDRRVALKVLPFASLMGQRQIARFHNEAHAAAQIHHPHIVPVYAVGSDRGVHYYAMQLIDGQPLDVVIGEVRDACTKESGRPNSAEAGSDSLAAEYSRVGDAYFCSVARLGIQAAEAIQAAHEYGVVHRDVKPSNLLLDADGELWITDFGLARCRNDPGLTRTGNVIGTIRYMSPEQARGDSALVDHRTDIYSLGATLYEMLTLRPAVRGTDVAVIVRQLDRETPYRPRAWNPNIPTDLENIVLKSIAKSREDRYATAQELADDLRRFLEGKPTVARPPSLLDRAGKWVRRHQAAFAGAVGVLLLLSAVLAVTTLMIAWHKQYADRAIVQYRGQLALSKNNLGLLLQKSGKTVDAEAAFRQAIALEQQLLAENPGDEQTLCHLAASLNNLSLLLGDAKPDESLQAAEEALRVQERLAEQFPAKGMHQSDLALAYNNMGSLLSRRGELQQASDSYRRAIAILSALPHTGQSGAGQPDLAVCWNNLGMAQLKLQQFKPAASSFRQAMQQIDRSAGERDANTQSTFGVMQNNLGMALERLGQTEAATTNYVAAIESQTTALTLAPEVRRFGELLDAHEKNLARVRRQQSRNEAASDTETTE